MQSSCLVKYTSTFVIHSYVRTSVSKGALLFLLLLLCLSFSLFLPSRHFAPTRFLRPWSQRGSFITSRSHERSGRVSRSSSSSPGSAAVRRRRRILFANDLYAPPAVAEKCRREIEFATEPRPFFALTNRYADIIVRHPRGTTRRCRRWTRQICSE